MRRPNVDRQPAPNTWWCPGEDRGIEKEWLRAEAFTEPLYAYAMAPEEPTRNEAKRGIVTMDIVGDDPDEHKGCVFVLAGDDDEER